MSGAEGRSHLIVGTLGRAVGLKGEVDVAVISDAPDRFGVGAKLLCGASLRELTIRSSRRQNDRTVLAFEEVIDRTGAEALNGQPLYIESAAARALDEGEFWDHDLIGCEVVTTDGRSLGPVTDVLHQPAGELLVVGDHLIPLIKDVIRSVVPSQRIEIEPLPGLLD